MRGGYTRTNDSARAYLRRCQIRGSRLEWKHAMTNTVSSTIRKNRAYKSGQQRAADVAKDNRKLQRISGEPPNRAVQFGAEARSQTC